MVRVCPLLNAIAGAASVARALPAPVQVETDTELQLRLAPDYTPQLTSFTKALQQAVEGPKTANTPTVTTGASSYNRDAAYAGATIMGAIGALIGGTIGAYMPANTTLNVDSILKGLTYELNQVNAETENLKKDMGLSLLTKLIPNLGSIIAQQPNLGRGPGGQEGAYKPPPPPAFLPGEAPKGGSGEKPTDVSTVPLPGGSMEIEMGKPKLIEGSKPGSSIVPTTGGVMEMGMPKTAGEAKPQTAKEAKPPVDGAKPVESKPKGTEMAEMEMAPPPSPGPPKPAPPAEGMAPSTAAPSVLPSEPKAPSTNVPSVPSKDTSTWKFPGLEGAAVAAAPVVQPTVTGMEGMGGHGHSGSRRR
ncbi:hypothetical protein Vi05172_g12172 [Venturia inaequalis]|nr:hypothetical protein Vi05172_g12172 [Venturia inaequalis]